MQRCAWAANSDIECAYHDSEWGVPLHGDQRLFAFLVLEGAQADLCWRTVLANFDIIRKRIKVATTPRCKRVARALAGHADAILALVLGPVHGLVGVH